MASKLPVVETFHSIQGEGVHTGRSAFFIRLANCNVGCSWCDTKESWSSFSHPEETIESLAKSTVRAKSKGAAFLVITGGEPLHHDLTALCKAIESRSLEIGQERMPIHLETSGVDIITGTPNWITLSPKRHSPPKKQVLKACQEIKVVVHTKEDILFAEEMVEQAIEAKRKILISKNFYNRSSLTPHLFLQPGWGHKEGQKLAVEYVTKNPEWRLSLQTHKWLKID